MRFQRKYANSEVFDPTKEKRGQKEMDFDVSGFIFCFVLCKL